MSDALFQIDNVSLSFGGLKAVADFKLSLNRGDLHGLIGPNGAGKTTAFNLMTGVYVPDTGTIQLEKKQLNGLPPWTIAKSGIARTFQNIRLFPDLSVLDNVRMACHLRARHNLLQTLLRTSHYYTDEAAMTARAIELLDLIKLAPRRYELARNLPYGDQRRLEIARALATGPKVLLLDEPAAGMHTGEKKSLTALIQNIRRQLGVTILLIEHDMSLVMEICEKITVLDHGQTIAVGSPGEVQKDAKVIAAYLGEPQVRNEPPLPSGEDRLKSPRSRDLRQVEGDDLRRQG